MIDNSEKLKIGNRSFSSRLMLGTGKYKNIETAINSIETSNCEIVTVAIRRLPTKLNNDHHNFLNALNWKKLWLLPNTAGSQTAEEAIRMAFLGHELACQIGQEDNFFIKLEVISDPKYLLPDPIGTLKAAEFLVKKGFTVLPYINADPMLALHLEDLGCATVMPLGSPIGSGQGLNNIANIRIIIENSSILFLVISNYEDVDLQLIANNEKCNRFSGADLASLVTEASMNVIKKKLNYHNVDNMDTMENDENNDDDLSLSMNDFLTALETLKPSITELQAQQYQQMANSY